MRKYSDRKYLYFFSDHIRFEGVQKVFFYKMSMSMNEAVFRARDINWVIIVDAWEGLKNYF